MKIKFVELIKQGNFYVAYEDSAIIIHYLFGYKIISNKYKTGFPISCISKVINSLENYKVSYVIKEKEQIVKKKDYKSVNKYDDYIEKANEKLEIETRMLLLEYKIKNMSNNEIIHLIDVIENEIRK